MKYVEWLRGIKCVGSYEVTDPPSSEKLVEVLKYELNPGDFPWSVDLINQRRLPEDHPKIDQLIHFLPKLVVSKYGCCQSQ